MESCAPHGRGDWDGGGGGLDAKGGCQCVEENGIEGAGGAIHGLFDDVSDFGNEFYGVGCDGFGEVCKNSLFLLVFLCFFSFLVAFERNGLEIEK